MATSVLERELRERKRRRRRGEEPDLAMEGARGFRNLLQGVASQGGWPMFPDAAQAAPTPSGAAQAAGQGELRGSFAPPQAPVQEPAAPGIPPQIRNLPTAPPQGTAPSPLFSNRAAEAAPASAPIEPMAPGIPRPPVLGGLQNYAGGNIGSQAMLDAWNAAQTRSQSAALNPAVAVAPPGQDFAASWGNMLPQGPQFTEGFGAPDPRFGAITGGPSDYIGNFTRAIINAPLGIAGELADAPGLMWGAAKEGWRQATTPAGQLQEEAAAEAKEAAGETAEGGPKQYHFPGYVPPGQQAGVPARGRPETVTSFAPAGAPVQQEPTTPGAPIPGTMDAAGAPAAPQQQVSSYGGGAAADPMFERGLAQLAVQETGGRADPYRTLGPLITHNVNGQPTQDQALGKYGIMESNLASWGQEAFGYPVTREEFLADEGMQEDLARFKFGQYWQMGTPADAASRWISGSPLATAGNEADFWGSTAESYTRDFLSGMGMEGLPQQVVPYQQGQAPEIPNPVDQRIPNAPDFSEQNRFFNQAQPTAPDANAQRQMMFNTLIAGIANANAGVDTRGPGGTGRLLAALGGGAATGRLTGSEQARQENEAFKQATQDYMMTRGQHAGDQARTTAAFDTQASQIEFENAAADQLAKYKNDLSVYGVQEANRLAGFTADQTNRANIGAFLERARVAQQPTYGTSWGGLTEQLPGQRPHIYEPFERSGGGGSDYAKYVDAARKGDYGPRAQYEVNFDDALRANDEDTAKRLIVNNAIASGQGPQLWGPEKWAEMQQFARDRVDTETGGGLIADQKLYIQKINEAAANIAWENYLNTGDESWLINAARMNDYGARQFQFD